MVPGFIENLDFTPKAIGQQLTGVLKAAIVNNELAGGEKLVERDLQKKFGVSRSPIREAIRDLEKMGLVEIVPRKGTIVKVVTKEDIKEDYMVRAPLEGLAAREAYLNMEASDREGLAKALQDMHKATKYNDHDKFWDGHAKFHNIFINACGNGLLAAILRMLRIHSYRHRKVFPNYKESLKPHLKNHDEIMVMFNDPKTDPKALEAFVSQHVIAALEGFLANIK